jgi:hypothetical protein
MDIFLLGNFGISILRDRCVWSKNNVLAQAGWGQYCVLSKKDDRESTCVT